MSFPVDVCRVVKYTSFLSVGDVSTTMSSRRSGDYYKGSLRSYVARQSMSPRRGRTSSAQRRSKVHGLFRGRTSSRQREMFRTVGLRDTYSRSGNGAVESVLQKHDQVLSCDLPVYYRYKIPSCKTINQTPHLKTSSRSSPIKQLFHARSLFVVSNSASSAVDETARVTIRLDWKS